MKVIDLLNKIANREEVPKKIRITDIDDRITRHYDFFYDEDDQEYKDNELFPIGARLILDRVLNKKVEILDKIEVCSTGLTVKEAEENFYKISEALYKEANKKREKKKPKKLGECAYVDGGIAYSWSKSEAILKTRINEIIDYLDYLKNKGDE